ncbi:hypothetical protein BKA69DRAFT_1049877 [Paraphysoderma sedebokerense]|nr:hypothetical protein BKA69DRAFT_1049877 [Paraphysoderma sedebokerense]
MAFVLLYDPFYDRRMSMIRVGIDVTALVGIILAFAIIFDDKSQATSIMNLHVLFVVAFPLGTWIGSNICRKRAKDALSTVVKSNTQELDLSKKFLGDPKFFFQYFLPWLMNNHSVDKLCLKWNEIDKQKFVCLATAVTQNQKLRHLDLSYNQINFAITEAGCGRETLIGLLGANTVLRTLVLDKNPLGDETAGIFCTGLAQNKSIMCLHLADCNLTYKTGEHLRYLLQHNKTIQEINLSWNHLGPTGVSTLGLGLKENTTLKKLDLTWNRFGNKGYEALKDALITNSTIEVLIVSSNNLSGQQKKTLEDLTRRDRTGGSALKENVEIDTQKLLQMYGGPQTLQKVVDNFYFKIVNDSNIKHYFANMSIHRMQHLQFNFLLEFLFNGPSYRGRNMKLAHASLRISDNDFDAVLLHLSTAFNEIMPQLDTNVRDLLMDKLENLREDIVSMKIDGDSNLSKEFIPDVLPEKKGQSESTTKTVAARSPVIAANVSKTDDIDLESGQTSEIEPSSGCPFSLSASIPTQSDSEIKLLVSEMWSQFQNSDVLAKYFKDPNSRMKKMFLPLFKNLLYHPEKSHSSLPQSLQSAQVASFHSIYNLSEAEFEEFIRLTQVAVLNVNFGESGGSVIEGLKKYKNLLCR